jgi:hypothetical protein
MHTIKFFLALCVMSAAVSANAQIASHCRDTEKTIWACRAGTKIYSLCASSDLSRSGGYLQYRAGRPNAVEMRFPAITVHPSQVFKFGLLAHGASLSFNNGQYSYNILQEAKGDAGISVIGPSKSATINCSDSTLSLPLNTTMELFESIGVWHTHEK